MMQEMKHTVAGEHEELIVLRDIVCDDVRICRYDLFLRRNGVVLLILKVAESTSQGQIA